MYIKYIYYNILLFHSNFYVLKCQRDFVQCLRLLNFHAGVLYNIDSV